ncbi:hypothetical protein [Rubellicoccus peritrichatus]|uniref:Uncharacterized protein n=1 Tax=Rubellicoccus peritrichatus TaxID=3080537 RepID=A0AAQ3QVR6_9BACT|nr:hypothetical protein [Puniceicoccus sp. CR14]WOO41175.1 hypothetical protein RZN69_21350 [Puniceicoccus sp. CR14]
MFPIPTELVTLLGTSLIGGIMKLFAMSQEAKRKERLYALQALNTRFAHIEKARKHRDIGFQWTRRVIALLAVLSVIVLPKVVAIWMPDLPVFVGYPEIEEGFMFFTSDVEKIRWVELRGLTLTPLDTHLLSAIIGLYFGGSLAGHNKL